MSYAERQLTIEHDGTTPRGVYDLIRDIDENVREQKDSLYDFQRETNAHFKFIEHDMGEVKGALSAVTGKVSTLQEDVSDVKGDVKGLTQRTDEIDKRIDDLHQSQNKWFAVLGFLIAAVPVILALIEKYIK